MTNNTHTDDIKLAAQIVDAMKEYDAADATYNAAGVTRKEKAIAAGKLLAEAKQRHPGKEAFKKFLELAGGVHISRADTLIAIALGRKDFEQHQAANAAAQRRHQDKLKAEREKAKAALPKPEPKSKPEPKPKPKPGRPLRNGQPKTSDLPKSPSATALGEFEFACKTYLPKLNVSDLDKAMNFFVAYGTRPDKKAA